MERVLPIVVELVGRHPERTLFTRFMPPERPEDAPGMWAAYYRRWEEVTLSRIDRSFVEVLPALARFVPPAKTFDKRVYSPWVEGGLASRLRSAGVDTLIITGGETDVCVLGTVLGAVDHGFRTIIVTDAVCSFDDQTHDAIVQLYHSRFSEQVETMTMEEVLDAWK